KIQQVPECRCYPSAHLITPHYYVHLFSLCLSLLHLSPRCYCSPCSSSRPVSAIGCPPSLWMATSNDTRVRLLGRWKMSASVKPSSGRPRSVPALAAAARSRMAVISDALRSERLSRSRPTRVELIVGSYGCTARPITGRDPSRR